MKPTLPELIKQNENLRNILLSQEGGIMKYLAEHLEANGTAELFNDYQNYCVDFFFEKNKWDLLNVWAGDEMRMAALGDNHLRKELGFQSSLKTQLIDMPKDYSNTVLDFTEQYLAWAYKQNRRRWHPNGMSNSDIYQEVIGMFSTRGLAYGCMTIILGDHYTNGKVKKDKDDQWTEFLIRQWSDQLTLALFGKMRQAVADMLVGKSNEQCRQMAIDTMDNLRNFSQKIYPDAYVKHLRQINYSEEADRRGRDGEWLRNEANNGIREAFMDHIKTHSIRFYLANFINIFNEVGRIWAAQLLVHGVDLKELEKTESCILNPINTPRYYVDKYYSNDLPALYCISNIDVAEYYLKKLGHRKTRENYLLPASDIKEDELRNKLSKAYNILTEEGFIDRNKTTQICFIEVLMNNTNKKIVWLKDPKHTILTTLFKVFLGKSKKYSYKAIMTINKGGSYAVFIKHHFVDENSVPINFKTNGHEVGIKEIETMDRIIRAIYNDICHNKKRN